MLENFEDQDIGGDILDTGYLYLDLPDGKRCIIDTCAAAPMTQISRTDYLYKKDGEYSHQYLSLQVLLINEGITYDDIRASWKYHGVLLGNAKFCGQLVHDRGCPCVLCKPGEAKDVARITSTIKPITEDFVTWCKGVGITANYVILDTETTGKAGEIVELAICDGQGRELYSSLLKPSCAIEPGAKAVHHIDESMVANAPTITDEWPRICDVVGGRTVITYNAKFDSERIAYSLAQHGLNTCPYCAWTFECCMVGYADFWDAPPRWKGANAPWQSLEKACYQQGVMLSSGWHRAMDDAKATFALIAKIAATGEASPRYRRG